MDGKNSPVNFALKLTVISPATILRTILVYNSEANAALTNLIEGIYFYRATAFIDGVPLLPTYDFFSTGKVFIRN